MNPPEAEQGRICAERRAQTKRKHLRDSVRDHYYKDFRPRTWILFARLVRAKQIGRWTSLVQRNFRTRSLLVGLGAGQDLVVVRI